MTARIIQPIFDSSQRMRPLKIARNRNRVNRQLFGPIDHEETRRFLEAEFKKEQKRASQAWDFDFVKGHPIQKPEGRLEWTKMSLVFAPRRPRKPEPEPDITELYAAPLPSRVEHQEKLSLSETEKKKDNDQSDEEALQNKQSKITDFMVIRKRNSESISKKSTEPVIPSKISKYNDVTS